jgi:HlyD family secretion protein
MTLQPTESGIAIRRLTGTGIAIIAVFLGGFCAWAATTRLSGAVIAPGIIVVESSVKKVAHSTGGVVREIMVREGSVVSAGQVVVRLDDTVLRASLGVVRAQLDQATARLARLTAERDELREVTFPAGLHERGSEEAVATSIVGERHLFESRRQLQDGQRLQLHERVSQNEDEVRALEAQLEANRQELKLTNDELTGVAELFQKQLAGITRFSQLKRDKARLEGEAGQLAAQIAQAHGKISEIKLQIIQLDQNFRTDLLIDLRDTQGKIAELTERLVGAQDQLQRVDIRAPLDGSSTSWRCTPRTRSSAPARRSWGSCPAPTD